MVRQNEPSLVRSRTVPDIYIIGSSALDANYATREVHFRVFFSFVDDMEDARVIYLADLEIPTSSTRDASTSPLKASEATSNPLKRQRTLVDMFAAPKNSQSEQSGQPEAKKAKLYSAKPTPSPVGVASTKKAGSSGLQRLNSIPFNLKEYIDSIPDDHKDLLKLECECMGKSWCVQ